MRSLDTYKIKNENNTQYKIILNTPPQASTKISLMLSLSKIV